jgi:hypothetical protein
MANTPVPKRPVTVTEPEPEPETGDDEFWATAVLEWTPSKDRRDAKTLDIKRPK